MDSTETLRRPLEIVAYAEGRQIARCLIRKGSYTIGSARKNEIIIAEPSVSAQHARLIVAAADDIVIEDLHSANGTFVAGAAIGSVTRVHHASEIQLGNVTLTFERGRLPAAAADELPAHFLRPQRYELGDVIVQGSTSIIHQARDTALGREVALRTLLPASQRDSAVVLRFIREAQITGQLGHAGILPVYDFGLNDSAQLFLTTRFIAGEPLSAILDRIATGDERAAERYGLPALIGVWQKVADIVAAAHSRGVVHNFISADAVEVARFGEIFLTQWTYAVVLETPADTTPIEAPHSTLAPPLNPGSAPEQAAAQYADLDTRTDIFALGALLYRIVTLTTPLPEGPEEVLLDAALSAAVAAPVRDRALPHWPRGKFPEFPAAVALKAMSYSRDARQQSVAEMQHELAAWQAGLAGESDPGRLWKQFTGLLHRPAHSPAAH